MTALMLLALSFAADPPAPPKEKEPDYEAELNDKLAEGVTPATNANVLLWRAFGPRPEGGDGMPAEYFQRLGVDPPPAAGDYFVDLTKFARDRLEVEPEEFQALYDQQTRASRRPWTAKDLPQIAAWLAANEKPLAVVVDATERPAYYNPLVSRRDQDGKPTGLMGALLPSVQKCREVVLALTARAMLRLGEGKADAAWADLLACHRLGRLVGRGGTLIEALVGYALDAVATNATLGYLDAAGPTADQLRGRLKDLQALPPIPPIDRQLDVGERYFYLDALQGIRTGRLDFDGKMLGEAERKGLAMIDWKPAEEMGRRLYDRMAAAARLPTRAERLRELEAIEAEVAERVKKYRPREDNLLARLLAKPKTPAEVGEAIGNTLTGLLLPALGKMVDTRDRATQVERNLSVAFALAAYRADHGKYPAALADLAPGYLKEVPDDLFSGKPLVYRPAADGYLLYSIGPNGKDDGGRSPDDDRKDYDLVVRMPVPKADK
ncbi:MAG: hypothetical protein K2X87_21800 [Gemmataceae bacterium]|nr:hypothetical protein [Gemmataceae bacterium]